VIDHQCTDVIDYDLFLIPFLHVAL